MTNHPLMNRLAVAVLLISAAVLGATASRDITLQQCRYAPERSQSTPQPLAHHAGGANHTHHAN